MNKYPITRFDNSAENIGISKRYNSYIEKNITEDSDFWIVFCHQDFGFNKDPYKKIKSLNKNNIYGAIGTATSFRPIRAIKKFLMKKPDDYSAVKRIFLGQISQCQRDSDLKPFGKKIFFERTVSSVDCCCLIVHSSLVNKYNLRFDENLNWHLYAEDFCINAKIAHNITSKVAQFDCFHLGEGKLNDDFHTCAKYVKNKHNLKWLKTTCIDG